MEIYYFTIFANKSLPLQPARAGTSEHGPAVVHLPSQLTVALPRRGATGLLIAGVAGAAPGYLRVVSTHKTTNTNNIPTLISEPRHKITTF